MRRASRDDLRWQREPRGCGRGSTVLQRVLNHFAERKRLIEFAVGEQPGVGGDLAAEEFELQAAVELDPQIPVLTFTHWAALSLWHVRCPNPYPSRAWRKSRAKAREVIWEMWVKTITKNRN